VTIEDFTIERECPRCRYTIRPGYWHEEHPQPEGGSHVVCSLRRANGMAMRGPLVEVLNAYFDKAAQADPPRPTTDTPPS